MTTPIPIIESTPDGLAVTSETVAAGTEVQHKNVLGLIESHAASLEAFGTVAFETRPFATAGGTQEKRVALLNEQQATLLMTFMRNSERVVQFKVALVKAFFDMAQRLAKPAELSRTDLARMVIAAEEEKAALAVQVGELSPRAEAWDTLASAQGDYAVDEAAKILSRDPNIDTGRDRLFKHMEALGWLFRKGNRGRWHAYQSQVDNGRLVQRMGQPFHNSRTDEWETPAPTIRVTAKGIQALRISLLPALELAG